MGGLLKPEDFDQILTRLQGKRSVEKYARIQELVLGVDVSKSKEFQRLFNGFYRVRQKSQSWYAQFYSLFQAAKGFQPLSFGMLLEDLRHRTNRLEASFTSKMFATLRTNQPVIDRFLLKHFKMRLPYWNETDRMAKAVAVHSQLRERLELLSLTPEGQQALDAFEARFPDFPSISTLKRIDLMLWQARGG